MTTALTTGVDVTVVASCLGTPTLLDALPADAVQGHADLLRDQGYEYVRVAANSTIELALAVTPGAPGGPTADRPFDTVVLCSDSGDDGVTPGDWSLDFRRRAGLDGVRTLSVTGSACANFGLGLEVARALVMSGASTATLVIVADRIACGRRYTGISRSIYSDGAVSCLVARGLGAGSFRVVGIATEVRAFDDTIVGFADARSTVLAMRTAAARALNGRSTDVRHVITLNLGDSARRLVAGSTSVPAAFLRNETIGQVAHCFAADIPLNLRALQSHEPADGGLVLALASSRHALCAVALEFQA